MRKAVICLAAGLAVLTVSAMGTFGSKPIENPDFAGPKVGLVKTDQNGDRVWQGAQPAIINKILAGFTPLQERYPNNIIGSALTSDRQVLEVYVRNVAGPGMEQLSALASKYPQRIFDWYCDYNRYAVKFGFNRNYDWLSSCRSDEP